MGRGRDRIIQGGKGTGNTVGFNCWDVPVTERDRKGEWCSFVCVFPAPYRLVFIMATPFLGVFLNRTPPFYPLPFPFSSYLFLPS